MDFITNILYWLSTGLLIPVTIFLIYYLIRSLILVGSFYGTHISRNKVNVKLNRQLSIETGGLTEVVDDAPKERETFVATAFFPDSGLFATEVPDDGIVLFVQTGQETGGWIATP